MTSLFKCRHCKKYFLCAYPIFSCGASIEKNQLICICLNCLGYKSNELPSCYLKCQERKATHKDIVLFKLFSGRK